jgi:ABC-type transport system involved in multi-copper enzyme maturation permease subunit
MVTNSQRVKKLFVTNPMRMEVVRFKSRFVNCTSNAAFNRALVALAVFSYLCIVALVFSIRNDAHPVGVIVTQAVVLLLAVAMAGHGAIAGERDRRSWDLLQVAPITQAEIVVGKFLGLTAVIFGLSLAFLPMLLISVLFYNGPRLVPLYNVFLAELIALTASLAIGSFTLYLSARLRNANTALAGSIASLVGILLVVPLGAAVLLAAATRSGEAMDALMVWHPVWAIIRILTFEPGQHGVLQVMDRLYGWPNIFLYLATTWFFIVSTNGLLKRRAKE